MTTSTLLLLASATALIVAILAAAWWIRRGLLRHLEESRRDDPALTLLQNQVHAAVAQSTQQMETMRTTMQSIQNQLNQSLETGRKAMDDRLAGTTRIMEQVQKSLGEIGQSQHQVLEVSRDLAGLQDTLKAPKLRGSLGELFLDDLLAQILPSDHYQTQYPFQGGMAVDAVIKLRAGLVPVDAKFPLENFTRLLNAESENDEKAARRAFVRDVKTHIDSISSKYIRPAEDTFDFALMYIPAENVYYETIIKDDVGAGEWALFNYALNKRVIPVSPNSFYAYLQTILLGLKGMRVEERARDILNHLGKLQNDLGRFREDFRIVGKHLEDSLKKYGDAERRLGRMQDKLGRIDGEAHELEGGDPTPLPDGDPEA